MCPLEGASSGDSSRLSSSRWNTCFASDGTREQHLPSTPRSLWGSGCHRPRPGLLLCWATPPRPWGAHTQGAGQAPHQRPAGRLEGRPAHLSAPHSRALSEQGRARVSVCQGSAHECWATSLSGGPDAEVCFPTLCPPGWGHTLQLSQSTHSLQPRGAESWQTPWGLWGPSGRPPPLPGPASAGAPAHGRQASTRPSGGWTRVRGG